jgi:hypothetical protein
MTEQQMIDPAYVIFAKQTILQPDLCIWNRLPATEHTWVHMPQHLCDAQTDLSSLSTAEVTSTISNPPGYGPNRGSPFVSFTARK